MKKSINNTILTLIQLIRTTIYTRRKYNVKCIRSPKEVKIKF